MKICALCLKNVADKKGSHLIPHFLVKAVDNVDGKPGRDLELGFKLTSSGAKGYFGRAVQPEKLDQVFGKLTDEQILNSRSDLIVDYLLCSGCEKRLGVIESEYAQIHRKFEHNEYQSTENAYLATMFWLSIFWRVSVSDALGFKLTQQEEELFRKTIDQGIDSADKDAFLKDQEYNLHDIKYQILRCPDYTKKRSGFIHFSDKNINPYRAIIGEIAISLSRDNTSSSTAFFDLELLLGKAHSNDCIEGEVILPVSEEIFNNAIEKVIDLYSLGFLSELSDNLDGLHSHFGGTGKMDKDLKQAIFDDIISDEIPLGQKYTPESMTQSIVKVMMKRGLI